MKQEKKCIVIGSNSFSGASFTKKLLEKNFRVFGCSRSDLVNKVFLPHSLSANKENFSFLKLDINHDIYKLIDLINENKIQYVVNFASQSMVAESWENPGHWFETNVTSTINLHNELRKLNFIKKYVHISTPEVYGNCTGLVDESSNFNPSTPYAVSRASSDMSLKTFGDAYDFPYVITRAANVFGPYQQLYRIVPKTIIFLLLGKKLQLHGGGTSKRSFVHVDDVSEATFKIMLEGKIKNTYHISTNELISIRSLVSEICNKLNLSFDKHIDVVGERLGKDANYSLDSSKIRKELGWRDTVSLNDGIENCIEWVKDNFSKLKLQTFEYIHKK